MSEALLDSQTVPKDEPSYHYSNLPSPRHIRLLNITPLTGGALDNVLEATLSAVNLDENPSYTCLSYVWENPTHYKKKDERAWKSPEHTLILHGYIFRIRLNLFNALHRLRRLVGLGPIWIDAVCINQNNNKEKTSQVTLMSDIYGSAKQVIAWLGEASSGIEEVINLIEEKVPVTLQDFRREHDHPKSSLVLSDDEKVQSLKRNLTPEELEKISSFIAPLTWFSRAWIVQETVLARDLRFLYGSFYISIDTIWKGCFCLTSLRRSHDNFDGTSTDWAYWACEFAQQVAPKYQNFSKPTVVTAYLDNIATNASGLRAWEATDGRDKVFAFLGLSCKRRPLNTSRIQA